MGETDLTSLQKLQLEMFDLKEQANKHLKIKVIEVNLTMHPREEGGLEELLEERQQMCL